MDDAEKLALAKAIGSAIMSELFMRCQPNRGDVFSWMDDHMPEISGAAAHAAFDAIKAAGYVKVVKREREPFLVEYEGGLEQSPNGWSWMLVPTPPASTAE
jgi:hypothetical protein